MALNRLLSIWLHPYDSFDDLEVELLTFHTQYNQSVHTHWFAHGALFGCALLQRDPKKVLNQGWLWSAVVPVHSRNRFRRLIRGVVQNFA